MKKVHKYVIETEIHFWSKTDRELDETDIIHAMRKAKDSVEYALNHGERARDFEERNFKGNWTYRISPKF